jgi:hypothetical protein
MSLIQAQEKYIAQVNACVRPNDRKHRVKRSANRKLHDYCLSVGITDLVQINAIKRDAWDMAELEHNSED